MSKIFTFIILGGVVLIAILAVNIDALSAGEETRFVPVSVLAEDQADYGVDKDLSFPVISAKIIEDKVQDLESTSSIPIIEYTSLPAEAEESLDNDAAIKDKTKPNKEEKNALREAERTEREEAREEAKTEREEEKAAKEELKDETTPATPDVQVPTPVVPDKPDKNKRDKPDRPDKKK